MGSITGSLAALLSVLMVSTSVSGSACDLSCWLHQAHYDCGTVGSAAIANETAMSMSSDMDMGPDHSESMGPDTSMNTALGHSMSPQMDIATERFEHATKPETRTTARANHSKALSSCTHEPCSRASTSASPPGGDHFRLNSLHWVRICILGPANLRIGFHWIGLGTHPPELLAADRLTATLRI